MKKTSAEMNGASLGKGLLCLQQLPDWESFVVVLIYPVFFFSLPLSKRQLDILTERLNFGKNKNILK